MSDLAQRIVTCHRCRDRAGDVCRHDGRPLEPHARLAYCPARRFGDGVKPDGWDDAEAPSSTSRGPSFSLPDDPAAVEEERRRTRAGGCCGAPSNS